MSTLANKFFVTVMAAATPVVPAMAQANSSSVHGKISLPANSPVSLLSADWGDSGVQARGGAVMLDVRLSLQLRNEDRGRRIRGVTLAVLSQSSTAVGGKASITVPTLDVGPGEAFPVRWNLQLLRPMQNGSGGPDVEVTLDGVLFDNLSFFGPDQLKSRRTMTVWELESRRDRKYFRALLDSGGVEGLRAAIVDAAQRQQDRPKVGVSMARGARVTNTETERKVEFAFLKMPESPVEVVSGVAQVSGNEAVVPRIEIRNKSDRAVQHLELGLIMRDRQGREFLAGSAPADPSLAPGQKAHVSQETVLRFPPSTAVEGMSGVVTSVEFGDGQVWVPSRAALNADPKLRAVMPPSPEEQRLLQLYQKRGIQAVIDELKR